MGKGEGGVCIGAISESGIFFFLFLLLERLISLPLFSTLLLHERESVVLLIGTDKRWIFKRRPTK